MRAHPQRPAGFTLIEMMVSLVVTALFVAAAMAVMIHQQRLLQESSADRALQETARTALYEVGENLRRAGYGMDPSLAFDFTCGSSGPHVQCHDSVSFGTSDDIVFHARDPAFKAPLAGAPGSTQLLLKGGIQAPLRRGQILQVMCAGAADTAYVTVGATVAVNWILPAAAPASTTVPLAAGNAAGDFPGQNAKLTAAGSCFQTDATNARVYRIDRFRYHVTQATATSRPYLMLDRGLLNTDGTTRDEPVAPDIDDLQFEYIFVDPTTGLTRAVGATSGVQLTDAPAGIDLNATPPAQNALNKDATRRTNHPANIRAVRVNVVVRSPEVDLTKRTPGNPVGVIRVEGPALPAAGNRPAYVNLARVEDSSFSHHTRIRVDATFQTRNMDSRAPFYDR